MRPKRLILQLRVQGLGLSGDRVWDLGFWASGLEFERYPAVLESRRQGLPQTLSPEPNITCAAAKGLTGGFSGQSLPSWPLP